MSALPLSDVTVSLTTTSRRIRNVEHVIRSLLDQDMPARQVVLWLSREPFLMDEGVAPEDIPDSLRALESHRFAIRWTANIGSYRKLVPTLQEYGGAIVTADDDTVYPPEWLRGLLAMHAQTPRAVCCWRARRMVTTASGNLALYWRWPRLRTVVPRADCLPIGKYGVLYPPGSLHPDVTDVRRFLELAPTADDIWFKAMAMRMGTPARCAHEHPVFRVACARTGTIGLFARYNLFGNNRAVARVFDAYPPDPLQLAAEPQQASG